MNAAEFNAAPVGIIAPVLAAAIADKRIPLTADWAPQASSCRMLAETKDRLLQQRRIRLGRRGDLGPVVKALHDLAGLLEAQRWGGRRLGIHTTDYVLLMRACYGPLLAQNPHTRRWGLVPRGQRPAGALEAARALTANVVAVLGGESGATVQDIRAAIDRLGDAA